MKSKDGYDPESFKDAYDAMDKNDDGKISKDELIEMAVKTARENGLLDEAASARPEARDESAVSRQASTLITDE